VRGIRLTGHDRVIGMVVAADDRTLLTVTENGFGKRTRIPEYRLVSRGSIGVRNIICSERNGMVASISSVTDNDEIMLITSRGITIRTPVSQIPAIGRNTQGVRLMRLDTDDTLAGATKIVSGS
jgi:DNA gyrase subunit A